MKNVHFIFLFFTIILLSCTERKASKVVKDNNKVDFAKSYNTDSGLLRDKNLLIGKWVNDKDKNDIWIFADEMLYSLYKGKVDTYTYLLSRKYNLNDNSEKTDTSIQYLYLLNGDTLSYSVDVFDDNFYLIFSGNGTQYSYHRLSASMPRKTDYIKFAALKVIKQNLYKTPDENAKLKSYVIQNDSLGIVKEQGDWLLIRYLNNEKIEAWIPKSSVY